MERTGTWIEQENTKRDRNGNETLSNKQNSPGVWSDCLRSSYFFIMPLPETVYIYYGSEMGTGEGFAEDLGAALTKNGIKNTVMDIDEFEEEDIVNQEVCIFFFSTYGNGMPTRSFCSQYLIEQGHREHSLLG